MQNLCVTWELEAASNEVEGQGDDPNPSGVKGKEGSRKNPQEYNDLEGETMEETKETKNIVEEGNREKDEATFNTIEAPFVGGETGQTSDSASNKDEGQGDGPNPSKVKDNEGGHKRPHE
ncbi:hypothetical protein Bca52824_059222 [Brassica carinata]|uniref:Uncharacterized protein n=1 Tax=Brassica carinata TaxID=52824 RepID=A0A8X7QUW1_BRACI|nr:hypothetical protein Bca52824_059222 [Brassica carinata]